MQVGRAQKAQAETEALAKGQEANTQQISRLRSQFAADYERFAQNTQLMQEQLQVVGKSLDAQHSNLTKVDLSPLKGIQGCSIALMLPAS